MRFYSLQHRFYCGIDLHARTKHVCILDQAGRVVLDKNLPCPPDAFLRAIEPFRNNLVVGVECMFAWYWVADLCAAEGIPFVLEIGSQPQYPAPAIDAPRKSRLQAPLVRHVPRPAVPV
jgi:hypothetical protein